MCRSLIVSTNPVAADAVGRDLIDQQRRRNGLPSIRDRAHHIETAAAWGLGPNKAPGISVIRLEAG